ncbi:hypothetical protein [Hymenobacter roseosalivarius]|uniref:hypothetical protein n=1 Tax=Hymenobacter roseosalivarius TaxID=89967 RepID=UPI00117AEA79|nr:hypothetical protein [Hymenobacter roseosalivarius]
MLERTCHSTQPGNCGACLRYGIVDSSTSASPVSSSDLNSTMKNQPEMAGAVNEIALPVQLAVFPEASIKVNTTEKFLPFSSANAPEHMPCPMEMKSLMTGRK